LLVVLLEQYNHAHMEQVDPAAQAQFIELHQTLLPPAEEMDEALVAGLRRSLGWALHTLANHYAGQADHEKAIEIYGQALAQSPEEAMLYRNRAVQYIELGQLVEAQADVERAAQLEPDAPRLAQLRQALGTGEGQE
jgi:tetratricopeptide (TPR) repeat protein